MLRVWYHNLKKEEGLARGSHGRGEGESQLIQGFCLGWGRRLPQGLGEDSGEGAGSLLDTWSLGCLRSIHTETGGGPLKCQRGTQRGGVAGESPAFRAI